MTISINRLYIDSVDEFCYHRVAVSLGGGENYGQSKNNVAEQYGVYGNGIVGSYSDHGC